MTQNKLCINSAKCWCLKLASEYLHELNYMPHDLQVCDNSCDDFLILWVVPPIWHKFAPQILDTSLDYTDPWSVPGIYSFLLKAPVHRFCSMLLYKDCLLQRWGLLQFSHVFSLNPIPLTLNLLWHYLVFAWKSIYPPRPWTSGELHLFYHHMLRTWYIVCHLINIWNTNKA